MSFSLKKAIFFINLLHCSTISLSSSSKLIGKYAEIDARIVGGNDTEPHQFPWMVYLQRHFKPIDPKNPTLVAACDGSLINNKWILSAAHCFNQMDGYQLDKVIVTLGSHDISLMSEQGRMVVVAEQVISHEGYDGEKGYAAKNDIALVKLSKTIEFDRFINAIGLPDHDDDKNNHDENHCAILGWGRTGAYEEPSPTLKMAKVAEKTTDECHQFYGSLDQTQVCAGTFDHGPCFGDSGGPLQCKNSNGFWYVEGIVSYGSIDCKSKPGVFTKVSEYLGWIEKTIKSNP